MGSGGTSTTRVPTRDPEPTYLTNIRTQLYDKIMPGLESYNANDWSTARNTANQALSQQTELLSKIPETLNQNANIANEIATLARTGNLPSGLAENLNASVNQELNNSMATMLNNLASRGVVNSSTMTQGVNNLSQQAADAYTRNYMTAYQAALSGMGNALQGQQNNLSGLTTGVYALGKIPEQVYEGAAAQLMPAYNMWKAMQNSYDTRTDFDTVVTQESGSCITGDTKVKLADGHEIPVSELTEYDLIQAWDFENGCSVAVPLTAFFRRKYKNGTDVIRVDFEDGSSVGVIKEHLFFDLDKKKFVAVNTDSKDFIGHNFAKVNDDGKVIPVKVKDIHMDGKATDTYAPQCEKCLNFIAEGFITGNDGQLGLCNRFEFDTDNMTYDLDKKKADLDKYGLLDYETMKDIISKEFFDGNHIEEFSVSIGKGLMSENELKEYLSMYAMYYLR